MSPRDPRRNPRPFSPFSLLVLAGLLASAVLAAGANAESGASPHSLSHSTPLSLDDYLSEVKSRNVGYQGALQSGQGAESRSEEGSLALSTTVFGTASLSSDAK